MYAFLLALMPGPDNIYVLTESVSKGWRQGVGITLGLVSGVVVHTTLVATGLSVIFFREAWTYEVLKYAGTAYLLHMSWGAFREAPMNLDFDNTSPNQPFMPLFVKGFTMNVLNPKVSLFFIVLLPQFVVQGGWSPMLQMSALGLEFMLVAFVVFSCIAMVSGFLASFVNHPGFWTLTKFIKVAVLLTLAALLFFSER